jgi:glutathione S-transferase
MTIRIYHVPRTRSIRVIWLCEELDVPYEIEPVDFSPEARASAEWRRLSPTGKVPVMADDGFTMFESGAMVQYVLERYGAGRLEPARGSAERAHFLQWCWFAEATLARPLGDMVHHLRLKPEAERIPAVVEDGRQRASLCLDAVESALDPGPYLLGDSFTAADIMMGYSLLLAKAVDLLDESWPRVWAYQSRLEARPGFVAAVA